MSKNILAIDNGTQSVRAVLIDPTGNIIAKSQLEFEPYEAPEPGWAELAPEHYWDKIGTACKELWAQDNADPGSIIGLTVTTQRMTLINLDSDGQPLRPSIVWMDQRRAEDLPSMGPLGMVMKMVGVGTAVDHFRSESEAHWIAKNQPEIWSKTAKFLFLSGYLNYKLTDKYIDSTASQIGYIPFDFRKRGWSHRLSWKWKALPVHASQFPELQVPGSVIGPVTANAAAHLGIPEGTPVIASGADKACEVIGAGVLNSDTACLSYGTRATVNVHSKRYFEAVKMMPPYPAALPDYYVSETAVPRGFWMVSWFKKEFGHIEKILAEEASTRPEALLDDLVKNVPAGSDGLILQPYWGIDTFEFGPEAKGAVIGFDEIHTRAHLYRAIIEGLVYELRRGKEMTEKRGRVTIKRLRAAGGGSRSDAVMQITADVFGLPVERTHTHEASGLGAAISVAVATGIYGTYQEAIGQMVRVDRTFTPNKANTKIYDQLYSDVYLKMYAQLQPLYQSIKKITG